MLSDPVARYMTRAVVSIGPTATLQHARELMDRRRLACLPVLDERRRAVGIVSRSDLLHVASLEGQEGPIVHLPDVQVRQAMHAGVVCVDRDATLGEAARMMLDGRIHHLCIEEGAELIGILGTADVVRAVADTGISVPVSSIMSHPVLTIAAERAVPEAIARLEAHDVSGLAVIEHHRPVGVFTERDALLARHLHTGEIQVGEVAGLSMASVAASTAAHEAAAELLARRAGHLLVLDDGSLSEPRRPRRDGPHTGQGALAGIVTGLDFAGVALLG